MVYDTKSTDLDMLDFILMLGNGLLFHKALPALMVKGVVHGSNSVLGLPKMELCGPRVGCWY